MKYSDKVKMVPYVGKNYKNESIKILILGLSTYARDKKNTKNHSIDIVNDIKNYNGQFHVRINGIFKHDDESKDDLWKRVAFQNYIQRVMDKPKQKNTKKDWENSKEPFNEVITKLLPDVVAVIGFETYDNLPDFYRKHYKTLKKQGDEMYISKYDLLGKPIFFCRIKHTASFGFIIQNWKYMFQKFEKQLLDKLIPSDFIGTWGRAGKSKFTNTLTFTSTSFKASSQNFFWVIQKISGDVYSVRIPDNSGWTGSGIMTIRLINGNLDIIDNEADYTTSGWKRKENDFTGIWIRK